MILTVERKLLLIRIINIMKDEEAAFMTRYDRAWYRMQYQKIGKIRAKGFKYSKEDAKYINDLRNTYINQLQTIYDEEAAHYNKTKSTV